MSKLRFHPVWDQTLTHRQKEEFRGKLKSLPPVRNEFEAVLVNGKYKKNGGAVATVFLRNSSNQPLEIKHIKVEISNFENELIAAEEFSPDLYLVENSVQPWSFVFAKESVFKSDSDFTKWKIDCSFTV